MQIRIKENSWIAKRAAKHLKTKRVALVIGNTIYLWQTSRQDFLNNKCWLQHELQHVQQFKKFGLFRFLFLYLVESARSGYYNNKFEVEAREKENQPFVYSNVEFI